MEHAAAGVAVGVDGACVAVTTGVDVRVGVRVGVIVRAGVAVTVAVGVRVVVTIGVGVAVDVDAGVCVALAVHAGVAVAVGGNGVAVVGGSVAVAERGVAVGVASLAVGVPVGVAVGLGTCLCDPVPALALAAKQDAVTSRTEPTKDRDLAARMALRAASTVPDARRRFHGRGSAATTWPAHECAAAAEKRRRLRT